VPDDLVFSLHHGLRLTLTGQPTLRAVGNFLKAATVHFKNQRDIQRVELYTGGSFQGRHCAVSNPGDSDGQYLSPAAWAEALIDAHAVVTTLDRSAPADPLAALGRVLTASPDQYRSPSNSPS
jgi:hypothetical protein